MKRKNKFKVGQLITDKMHLLKIIAFENGKYVVKIISAPNVDNEKKIVSLEKERAERLGLLYDLNNPLKKVINTGICRCENCYGELHLGDDCIRYDDNIYCSEECLLQDLGITDDIIREKDLYNSNEVEVPLFELSEAQLELIKELKNG